MWLCWLPVLMDALTSVSQHCGEERGGILVSQCDFPLRSGSTTREETSSHNSTLTKLWGAFESHESFLLNKSIQLPNACESARLRNKVHVGC